jgi:hypothetical protein
MVLQKPVTCGYSFHSAAAHEAAKEMDPTKQANMKRLFSGHQLAILESRMNYCSDEDMLKHMGFIVRGDVILLSFVGA